MCLFDCCLFACLEMTKDCPDLALVKSWTCAPSRRTPSSQAVTMATAPPEDNKYDSLPQHGELEASLAADGTMLGTSPGSRSVDVPRVNLSGSAMDVRQQEHELYFSSYTSNCLKYPPNVAVPALHCLGPQVMRRISGHGCLFPLSSLFLK